MLLMRRVRAAALAELAFTPGRRNRLLARHDTGPDVAGHERAAQLCITVGADMDLIEQRRGE